MSLRQRIVNWFKRSCDQNVYIGAAKNINGNPVQLEQYTDSTYSVMSTTSPCPNNYKTIKCQHCTSTRGYFKDGVWQCLGCGCKWKAPENSKLSGRILRFCSHCCERNVFEWETEDGVGCTRCGERNGIKTGLKNYPSSTYIKCDYCGCKDIERVEHSLRCTYCGFARRVFFDSSEDEVLHKVMENRPGWTDYFLGLSFAASRRSHDVHTKHGCCLVDPRSNRILSLGYNGHPRGSDSSKLPLTRPEKYPWMDHAEPNAIANLTKDPYDVDGGQGPVAYITGKPCFDCALDLTRYNIRRWVVAERKGMSSESEQEVHNYNLHIELQQVRITVVKPDLNWMFEDSFRRELAELGFINSP